MDNSFIRICSELTIGVNVLSLVAETGKGAHVWLDGRTNAEVHSKLRLKDPDTTALVMASEVRSAFEFGGERVLFSRAEYTAMKSLYTPGLTLMGFKPRDRIKDQFHIRQAYFLYPDETVVAGSTAAFQALLETMAAREVVAVCRLVSRLATEARFVALLPQREELDEAHAQITPPGFHVIFLPFAEDMRKPPHDRDAPKATRVR
jgi:ATP-dependent DNA helicase 2 subunit 1